MVHEPANSYRVLAQSPQYIMQFHCTFTHMPLLYSKQKPTLITLLGNQTTATCSSEEGTVLETYNNIGGPNDLSQSNL